MTLLVANLLFLAWAKWIDSPRDAGAQDALSHLPRLQLVGETPGAKPAAANLPPAAAEKVVLHVPETQQTCTSVGPFKDITHAARAAGLLTQRGFQLKQRAEEGETIEGYWVFIGGMQSDDEVNEVVQRLEKSGFTDAHVMKNFSTNRRISVGMFSTRERADKRSAQLRSLGFEPEMGERKFQGTIYWVDVALGSGPRKELPEYLFTDVGRTAKVETHPCPVGFAPQDQQSPPSPSPAADGADDDGVAGGLPRTTVASVRSRQVQH